MTTDDFPNGAILVSSDTLQPMLVVQLTTMAKWGYSLNSSQCWAFPSDTWHGSWHSNNIPHTHINKAKSLLKALFDIKQIDNLSYIEALAKLKEYEVL